MIIEKASIHIKNETIYIFTQYEMAINYKGININYFHWNCEKWV